MAMGGYTRIVLDQSSSERSRGWARCARPRQAAFKQALCADIDGLGLHAAMRCAADDRKALEQLCRYISRPVLAGVASEFGS